MGQHTPIILEGDAVHRVWFTWATGKPGVLSRLQATNLRVDIVAQVLLDAEKFAHRVVASRIRVLGQN